MTTNLLKKPKKVNQISVLIDNPDYPKVDGIRIIPRPVWIGYPAFFREADWFLTYFQNTHKKEWENIDLDSFYGLMCKAFAAKLPMAEAMGMGPDFRKTVSYHDPSVLLEVPEYYMVKNIAEKHAITIDADAVYEGKIDDEHGRSQKLSRYLTKKLPKEFKNCVCDKFGRDQATCPCESFNLSNVLSKLMEEAAKLKKKIVISCNPMDILYSSENAGFSSCHSLSTATSENPCHRSGNFGYIVDDYTFICYTYRKDDQDVVPYKTGRMLGYISKDRMHVLMMRAYGDFPIAGAKEITQNLTNSISKRLGIEYDWHAENEPGFHAKTDRNNTTSYLDAGYVARYSYHKASTPWDFKIVFAAPVCPNCGDDHTVHEEIFCDNCHFPHDCKDCQTPMRRGQGFHIRDHNFVCGPCYGKYQRCGECCKFKLKSEGNFRRIDSYEICGECYPNYFVNCTNCNQEVARTRMTYYEGHYRHHGIGGDSREVCRTCRDRLNQEDHDAYEKRRQEEREAARREEEARRQQRERTDGFMGRERGSTIMEVYNAMIGENLDGTPRNPRRPRQPVFAPIQIRLEPASLADVFIDESAFNQA